MAGEEGDSAFLGNGAEVGGLGAVLGWRTAGERQRTWRKEVEGKRCQNLGILWKDRAKA